MSRLLPGLLVMGVIGLASCTGSPDQEQITQLQAEIAELRAAIQSQQEAPAAGDADPETADDAVSEDIAALGEPSPPQLVQRDRQPPQPAHRDAGSDHGRHAPAGRGDHHPSPDDRHHHGHGPDERQPHDHSPDERHHGQSQDDRHRHEHRPDERHRHDEPSGGGHNTQHEQSEDHGDPGQTFVRPTGTVIGVIQAIKDSGGRHINVSILAPGEERPRDYFVYDKQDVLAEVRMGKVGDRVEIGWVQTNHGPAIETFEVLE